MKSVLFIRRVLAISTLISSFTILSNPFGGHGGVGHAIGGAGGFSHPMSSGGAERASKPWTPTRADTSGDVLNLRTLRREAWQMSHPEPSHKQMLSRSELRPSVAGVRKTGLHRDLPHTMQSGTHSKVRGMKRFGRRNLLLIGGQLVPWWWYYNTYPSDSYNDDGMPLESTQQPTSFVQEPTEDELEKTSCYNKCMGSIETRSEEECDQECGAQD